MSQTPDCIGLIGHLMGHRMAPRYSERKWWPEHMTNIRGGGWNAGHVMNYTREYEGDVCVRCGHRVDRRKETD